LLTTDILGLKRAELHDPAYCARVVFGILVGHRATKVEYNGRGQSACFGRKERARPTSELALKPFQLDPTDPSGDEWGQVAHHNFDKSAKFRVLARCYRAGFDKLAPLEAHLHESVEDGPNGILMPFKQVADHDNLRVDAVFWPVSELSPAITAAFTHLPCPPASEALTI
jgi:hypothetical protein